MFLLLKLEISVQLEQLIMELKNKLSTKEFRVMDLKLMPV
jgi:hypothetical protein